MAPRAAKRGHDEVENGESKKPRRSTRISSQIEVSQPAPVRRGDSFATISVASFQGKSPRTPANRVLSPEPSQPSDTQPYSQLDPMSIGPDYEVEDEEKECVWGYLVTTDENVEPKVTVLKDRTQCPNDIPEQTNIGQGKSRLKKAQGYKTAADEEIAFENVKNTANGYTIGRNQDCDISANHPLVSGRHCVIYKMNTKDGPVAMVHDISHNGTFIDDKNIGRNKHRELKPYEPNIIQLSEAQKFQFHYPKYRVQSNFHQKYVLMDKLGKGHFATVYLCVNKSTGEQFAVKLFDRKRGPAERAQSEGLKQEVAVLMSVNHPNMLCLKETFEDDDAFYLVLELAPEGELFNWIIDHEKLSIDETRSVMIQLLQGIKYLHDRGIVHRDIKPENILLVDNDLTIKLADFGLAKIIGEESFTTTLCGTPSYVAPEVLNESGRRYTNAVDMWALGVVMYICLCGFPPFSDELYSREYPFNLMEQIKRGSFFYPSPYWDHIPDAALDLIDRMLTVNPDKRITVDQALRHPWINGKDFNPNDSTDGLTGAIANLDFATRKMHRERTLLSTMTQVRVTKEIPANDSQHIKVFEKKIDPKFKTKANGNDMDVGRAKESTPAANRAPAEFMELGGKGDQELFDSDEGDEVDSDVEIGNQKRGRKH